MGCHENGGSGITRSCARWARVSCRGAYLRGFSAAPGLKESTYHVDEYVADALAIADLGAAEQRPFHLMATSIGASIAGAGGLHPA